MCGEELVEGLSGGKAASVSRKHSGGTKGEKDLFLMTS